jgi:hypothetical protein
MKLIFGWLLNRSFLVVIYVILIFGNRKNILIAKRINPIIDWYTVFDNSEKFNKLSSLLTYKVRRP